MKNIIEAMNWRYATKAYDASKKLSKEQLDTVLDAAILSASSFGLQPYKFILVNDMDTRKKLREAAWGQTPITDASQYVVLAARTDVDANYVDNFVKLVAETRGAPLEALKGYSDMMKGAIAGKTKEEVLEWNKKQAYIALGTMLATTALLGVDSTPMEGFDPKKFDEILGLDKLNLTSTVGFAIGFRAKDDVYANYKKVRFAKSDIVVIK